MFRELPRPLPNANISDADAKPNGADEALAGAAAEDGATCPNADVAAPNVVDEVPPNPPKERDG